MLDDTRTRADGDGGGGTRVVWRSVAAQPGWVRKAAAGAFLLVLALPLLLLVLVAAAAAAAVFLVTWAVNRLAGSLPGSRQRRHDREGRENVVVLRRQEPQ